MSLGLLFSSQTFVFSYVNTVCVCVWSFIDMTVDKGTLQITVFKGNDVSGRHFLDFN